MRARRPALQKAVGEARERGDLSENADYHAAKEALAMLDEISDLDDYAYYHAARGSYLTTLGKTTGAVDAYRTGETVSTSEPQRQFFSAKLTDLSE